MAQPTMSLRSDYNSTSSRILDSNLYLVARPSHKQASPKVLMISLILLVARHFTPRHLTSKPATYPDMPQMVNFARSSKITAKLEFRWACYTYLFMIVLLSGALAVAAVLTVHKVHDMQLSTPWMAVWQNHESNVVLLAVFGFTVVIWLFILVGINTYWPNGCIYERRRKRMGGDGGAEMGRPGLLGDAQVYAP